MRFSKEYSKLKKQQFTTIRKHPCMYKVGRHYTVVTPSETFKVEVISKEPQYKYDITDQLAQSDADCTAEELIVMLNKWYGAKKTCFELLTLKRLVGTGV